MPLTAETPLAANPNSLPLGITSVTKQRGGTITKRVRQRTGSAAELVHDRRSRPRPPHPSLNRYDRGRAGAAKRLLGHDHRGHLHRKRAPAGSWQYTLTPRCGYPALARERQRTTAAGPYREGRGAQCGRLRSRCSSSKRAYGVWSTTIFAVSAGSNAGSVTSRSSQRLTFALTTT
jgi:hypothetical protein